MIGMPANANDAKLRLGTGIVKPLSNQMEAESTVVDAMPGTKISITHREVAVIVDTPEAA